MSLSNQRAELGQGCGSTQVLFPPLWTSWLSWHNTRSVMLWPDATNHYLPEKETLGGYPNATAGMCSTWTTLCSRMDPMALLLFQQIFPTCGLPWKISCWTKDLFMLSQPFCVGKYVWTGCGGKFQILLAPVKRATMLPLCSKVF